MKKRAWIEPFEDEYVYRVKIVISGNGHEHEYSGGVRMTWHGHLYAYDVYGEGKEFTEQPDWNPMNRHDEIDKAIEYVKQSEDDCLAFASEHGFEVVRYDVEDNRYALDRFGSKRAMKKRAEATCLYRDDFGDGVFGEVFFAPSMDENEQYYWSVTYDGNVIADGFCATEEEAFNQLERNVIYASKSAMKRRTSSKSKIYTDDFGVKWRYDYDKGVLQSLTDDPNEIKFNDEWTEKNGWPLYELGMTDDGYLIINEHHLYREDFDDNPEYWIDRANSATSEEAYWETRFDIDWPEEIRRKYEGSKRTSSKSKKMKKRAYQGNEMPLSIDEMVDFLQSKGFYETGYGERWELMPMIVQDAFGNSDKVMVSIVKQGQRRYRVQYYCKGESDLYYLDNYRDDDTFDGVVRGVLHSIAEELGY